MTTTGCPVYQGQNSAYASASGTAWLVLFGYGYDSTDGKTSS